MSSFVQSPRADADTTIWVTDTFRITGRLVVGVKAVHNLSVSNKKKKKPNPFVHIVASRQLVGKAGAEAETAPVEGTTDPVWESNNLHHLNTFGTKGQLRLFVRNWKKGQKTEKCLILAKGHVDVDSFMIPFKESEHTVTLNAEDGSIGCTVDLSFFYVPDFSWDALRERVVATVTDPQDMRHQVFAAVVSELRPDRRESARGGQVAGQRLYSRAQRMVLAEANDWINNMRGLIHVRFIESGFNGAPVGLGSYFSCTVWYSLDEQAYREVSQRMDGRESLAEQAQRLGLHTVFRSLSSALNSTSLRDIENLESVTKEADGAALDIQEDFATIKGDHDDRPAARK